jgi:hypothetical protein
MDEELPIPESSIPVEFYKHTSGKLFMSCAGLESLMNEIIDSADEFDVDAMKTMQEIILLCLDKGKAGSLFHE